jgi:hypothetical protein
MPTAEFESAVPAWELGVSQGRSERVRKISPPPGFDSQTFQQQMIYIIINNKSFS